MAKEITVCVPRYVWKFLKAEPDYTVLPNNTLQVPHISEIGRVILSVSRVIPFTQRFEERKPEKGWVKIKLRYYVHYKGFDVPADKYSYIEKYLIEFFRASLVREVSAIHNLHPENNYSWIVRSFLERREIITSDEEDKDVEFDTVKKIYRDHLGRVEKKNRQNYKLSQSVLS